MDTIQGYLGMLKSPKMAKPESMAERVRPDPDAVEEYVKRYRAGEIEGYGRYFIGEPDKPVVIVDEGKNFKYVGRAVVWGWEWMELEEAGGGRRVTNFSHHDPKTNIAKLKD